MKSINLNEYEGNDVSLEGYTCASHEENIFNWISSNFSYEVAEKISSSFDKHNIENVAVLKSIYIEEDLRNKGYGTALFDYFLEEISYERTEMLFLELNNDESNDFSLKEWYERYGFEFLKDREDFKDVEGIESLMFLDLREDF